MKPIRRRKYRIYIAPKGQVIRTARRFLLQRVCPNHVASLLASLLHKFIQDKSSKIVLTPISLFPASPSSATPLS